MEDNEIVVHHIEEHEDGSATINFTLGKDAQRGLVELGMELILTCAAYQLDVKEALSRLRVDKEETQNDAD
jgi:hypothetical protein